MKKLLFYIVIITTQLLTGATVQYSINDHLTIVSFSGQEAKAYINDIARIRIELFREYPYLYDGSFAHEQEYLEIYFSSPNSEILIVFDYDNVVGFSTSIPLAEAEEEVRAAFIEHSYDINNYLYLGEGMLYPPYRKQKILRKFSDFHEAKARKEGYAFTTFMMVERPDNHPLKPDAYQSPEPICKHFGYELMPDLHVHIAYPQVDTQTEIENTLAIWCKKIE